MKSVRELDEVAAALRRLLASREHQLVQGERLRQLLQKLEAVKKGGKAASSTQVVRLIAKIGQTACEECVKVHSE